MKNLLHTVTAVLLLWAPSCTNNGVQDSYTAVVEGTLIQVPALLGGRIIAFPVERGEALAAGALIAVIDTTELSYTRQQLLAAMEELDIQRKISDTQVAQSEDNTRYLREKQERVALLAGNQSAPQQTLDDITQQLTQAQSALQTARHGLRAIAAKRKQLQAQIHIVEKKIGDALIVAPAAGRVTEKYFQAGEAVPPMNPVVEITHLQDVTVKIYVSERQLPEMKPGRQATVLVDGLDRRLPGHIVWISPKAEFTPKSILTPETRTSLVYAVEVAIENADGILKHGMPVDVHLD